MDIDINVLMNYFKKITRASTPYLSGCLGTLDYAKWGSHWLLVLL